MKDTTKRLLSLVLCFVMVVGLMPALSLNADAAETVIDAAIFCSDVHGSSSDLTSVLGGVAKSNVDYSSIGFVGDTCLTVANTTSIVQSALSDTDIEVMFSYASSHDNESGADIATNWNYSGEVEGVSNNYLVYTIRETDMQNASDANTAAPAFTTWYNGLTAAQKALPIFIMSHRPLHDRRDDNAGAATWYDVISAAAETSDIVFFWAHNHTSESTVDTDAYYVAKNGTESFDVYNGDTVTPNFTYMNAGYINANGQNPARKGIATTVQITAGSLIFQDYNSSGAYSGTYAHNVTVEREFASQEVTLSSIAISGTTSYFVGDKLALTVTATYSDGTTADVTAETTLSGYDMSTAGTQTVTATYGGKTATIDITVTAVQINSIAVTTQPTKLTYTTGEELDTTGMVVTATYNNGTTAEVTGWYTSTVDMTTAGEKTVTVNYMVDGITYKTTFTITVEEGVAEGVTLESIEITKAPDKTEYLISEELALDGMVVVATFSDGSTVELAYKPFSTSTVFGGYELDNFSMYVEKAHEVVVTYTFGEVTCTDTTTINVWNEDFTDTATGVKVHVTGDYGVTSAAVAESTNEHVASAISGVISGDNYAAYDISLVFDEGYTETETTKTVTLPIPAGVNNPVVYYVSDDGETVTNMNAVKGEGVVTFETTHFSTYVIGESAEIELPENQTASGSGETTTTTKKTVYVLTSSISSGNEYLIVNGNSTGSCYALANNSGSVAATGVTVKTDSEIGTYIELDDATDELWTVGGSYTFKNGSYYLYPSTSGSGSLKLETSSRTWSYSNNRLSYTRTSGGGGGGGNSSTTYYLRYSNGWTVTSSSSSATSIYFYVPTEVEVETTTTVSGTYSIAGEDLTAVVVEGTTKELTSTLTFTPDSGDATTEDVSTTATYEIVTVDKNGNTVNGDPNGIIEKIENGVVTFTGSYGEALVKVSYTTDFGVVTDYITVTASAPYHTVTIWKGETNVTGTTIPVKGVTGTTTLQLSAQVIEHLTDTSETITPDAGTLEWAIPAEYQNIATIDQNGLITFKGVDGAFYVTVTYTDPTTGKDCTAGVNISATTTSYSTPTDGTGDFPEYPNEGAIRYDKTGTAVGNFSQTGIAQVELSMTGVPYTTGSEIDVVIMLDMTGSMSDTAMTAAEESAIAFAEQIVKNTDGSYNSNRVAVLAFNSGSSSPYTLWSMGVITEATWSSFCTNVRTASDNQESGGTPYDEALEKCQSVLQAAKTDGIGNDRQQFCVFVSDGGPTSYKYITNYDAVKAGTASAYTTSTASATGGSNQSDSNFATIATYTHEYYSTLMKDDGVTMYSVLTGLVAANYPNCTTILKNIASDSSKAYVVEDGSDTSSLTNAFTNIAVSILQAATDVTVEDKITDEYTMIFDIPEGTMDITGVTNDFYIEFGKYALDEENERTEDGYTSVTKLYLQNTNGTLSAKDTTAPVFEAKTIGDKGTLYYWSTNASDGDTGVSVTAADGTTYYFVSYGMESGYNMTSGGYADGTVDSTTNMSTDLVIATPYFVYNAKTRMLYWTVDKLDTYEYVLRYFLYLDDSATEVGTTNETDSGPYPTNDHAYITYTNFKGNDCRQEFPIPQMTWNGATVSYVFYLVNEAGQPINKSGQPVDFANATFVTDVYTHTVVWNGPNAQEELNVEYLADELLPDDYTVYDEMAQYTIHVYQDEAGNSVFDYFIIEGSTEGTVNATNGNTVNSDDTTKVYNTKAGTKYSEYGIYSAEEVGKQFTTTDANGNPVTITTTKQASLDYSDTTVAFAVVWKPYLVEDVVVVDYGLDVLINVVQNDNLQNTVGGIGLGVDAYGKTAINTGVSPASKLDASAKTTSDGSTISIENENQIRFHQNDMQFEEAVIFYYESPVEFWEDSNKQEGYMYSSVTVIPATTIYYEDEFVDLKTFTKQEDGTYAGTAGWSKNSTDATATQDQDRPGASKISDTIDADNNYGYDSAYETMSQFSMDSAAMVTVKSGTYATAEFTFYGTGFDIISMTDTTTGTILVDVYEGANTNGTLVVSEEVDTYYGYKRVVKEDGTYDWEATTPGDPNALYQVPVMKIGDGTTTDVLPYGQYTAVITVSYLPFLDPNAAKEGYDFYLDAIRIYNPTGNLDETSTEAYIKDGEAYPEYFEVRDQIIEAEKFNSLTGDTSISGIVFIDGAIANPTIEDYKNYGPNNELYLAEGQAVAFELNATAKAGKVAKIQLAVKTVGGTGDVEVYSVGTDGTKTEGISETIKTATDMYYDITALNGKTVVIKNAGTDADGDAIISITNVKVTYTAPQTTEAAAASEEGIETAEAPALFSIRRSTASAAVLSLTEDDQITDETEPEETEPETTVPEETEPETTVPEETEPETTVPEETEPETTVPEETEPETTEPENDPSSGGNTNPIIELIRKLLGWIFG